MEDSACQSMQEEGRERFGASRKIVTRHVRRLGVLDWTSSIQYLASLSPATPFIPTDNRPAGPLSWHRQARGRRPLGGLNHCI